MSYFDNLIIAILLFITVSTLLSRKKLNPIRVKRRNAKTNQQNNDFFLYALLFVVFLFTVLFNTFALAFSWKVIIFIAMLVIVTKSIHFYRDRKFEASESDWTTKILVKKEWWPWILISVALALGAIYLEAVTFFSTKALT